MAEAKETKKAAPKKAAETKAEQKKAVEAKVAKPKVVKAKVAKPVAKVKTNKVVRTATGRVVSDKMDKTVTVLVERVVKHPLYGKVMRRSNKFHAHDETNQCHEGDLVVIEESRPLSRTKTWVVAKVLEKGQAL